MSFMLSIDFMLIIANQGKKVGGNDQGTSRINVKRKYR